MILRALGLLFAAAAVPTGVLMIARRVRVLVRGETAGGTIDAIVAAPAGGATVYHLVVETDDPPVGVREVRAYRQLEVDTRVRIWVHPSRDAEGWLAEWSHIGYELMIGAFVTAAGVLAAVAAVAL